MAMVMHVQRMSSRGRPGWLYSKAPLPLHAPGRRAVCLTHVCCCAFARPLAPSYALLLRSRCHHPQILGSLVQYGTLVYISKAGLVSVLSIWAALKILAIFRLVGGYWRNFLGPASGYREGLPKAA